jgi:hypothetical protein
MHPEWPDLLPSLPRHSLGISIELISLMMERDQPLNMYKAASEKISELVKAVSRMGE